MSESWRRCSSCKSDIALGAVYWVCSVSTCNRKRTGLVFCSTDCWDAHLGYVNHRESWAEERRAPATAESAASPPARAAAESRRPARRIVVEDRGGPAPSRDADLPREVLIVASKLKAYIKARSGMNTSDRVLEPLSELVRRIADRAIESARRDERKTVLDRDLPRT